MPAFIMPLGDNAPTEYALQWQRATIGYFAKGYLEAMFFTECHSDNPELEDGTINDMSAEAWDSSLADCAAFVQANAALIERAYVAHEYSEERAGNDFWFTRNRHGVGFWDRGLGEVGKALTDAAHTFGTVDLYRGDDGKLYLA